jgi:hypothetical protein
MTTPRLTAVININVPIMTSASQLLKLAFELKTADQVPKVVVFI